MGRNSFHKHKQYTYSTNEFVNQLRRDNDEITLDNIFDKEYCYKDTFDIKILEEIFQKYEVDKVYLEPLHSQAIAVNNANSLIDGDYDLPVGLVRCVDAAESERIEEENKKSTLRNFLILRKEFASALLMLMDAKQKIEHKDNMFSLSKPIIHSPIINDIDGILRMSNSLPASIIVQASYHPLISAFMSYGLNYDIMSKKEIEKYYMQEVIERRSEFGEKYTLKSLPEKYRDEAKLWAKLREDSIPLKEEEINRKNLQKYTDVKMEETPSKKAGTPKKYSLAVERLILRLSFLLRINKTLETFELDRSITENLSKDTCECIYEILRCYDLIENKEREHSSGDEIIRAKINSIVRKINGDTSTKEAVIFIEELSRVDSFVWDQLNISDEDINNFYNSKRHKT